MQNHSNENEFDLHENGQREAKGNLEMAYKLFHEENVDVV